MEITFLTDYYPFAPGEEFVHTEIPYLAAACSQVHLVPTAAVGLHAAHRRTLPPNVLVRRDIMAALQQRRQRPRAWRALAAWHDPAGRRLLRQELAAPAFWDAPRWVTARLRRLMQYVGHALMVRDALRFCGAPAFVYSYWLQAGVLGAALAGHTPLVARAHGADLYPSRHRDNYLPLQEETIRRLSRLELISAHGLEFVRRRYPLLAGRCGLQRLGVPAAPGMAQTGAGVALHVLSCATLVPVKRVGVLIDALAGCPYPVVWTHVGDGPLRPALQRRAARLPPHITVVWAGLLRHSALQAFYEQQPVDVFVNTSTHEGLPVSIMEALSYGVPVVATDVGGTRELVGPAGGILLPPCCRPAQIVAALTQVATLPPADRLTLRHRARHTWATYVDAAVQYPQFADRLLAALHVLQRGGTSPTGE